MRIFQLECEIIGDGSEKEPLRPCISDHNIDYIVIGTYQEPENSLELEGRYFVSRSCIIVSCPLNEKELLLIEDDDRISIIDIPEENN